MTWRPIARLALALLALSACEPREAPRTQAPDPPSVVAAPITPQIAGPSGFGAAVGFRSRRQLDDHFAKHGTEFDAPSPPEYLRLAQALRDTAAGGPVLETRRADGVVTRFHRETGAFLAFNADGTIRTFFVPNDGEAYFRRQARRRPGP
jgi:hypothetical protein